VQEYTPDMLMLQLVVKLSSDRQDVVPNLCHKSSQ
jgi:hypothetical protein